MGYCEVKAATTTANYNGRNNISNFTIYFSTTTCAGNRTFLQTSVQLVYYSLASFTQKLNSKTQKQKQQQQPQPLQRFHQEKKEEEIGTNQLTKTNTTKNTNIRCNHSSSACEKLIRTLIKIRVAAVVNACEIFKTSTEYLNSNSNIIVDTNYSDASSRTTSTLSNNTITTFTTISTTSTIITVANTMASAASSVSMAAIAAIPTTLVIAATGHHINVTAPTNHSSAEEIELIEMDLMNQTLSAYPALKHYHGNYDVSYIAKINPFWLQFEPPTARTYFIMAIIYIIISSVGCLGNALVIFMFIRCKSLRTPANTLVINLAVSDLMMLSKGPIAIYNNIKQGPALGDIGCRIYGFIGGLSGTASIGTLTAIAFDRYNVVVYPLDPLRKTSKLRSYFMIILIWIYSFIFSVIPALDIGLSVYVPEGFLTTCSFDYLNQETDAQIFMFSFFVAAWCIPFGIICFSYFYILKVVFAANRIQSSKDKNKTEHKLAMIVIGIIGLWFLAWTPYSVVAMMGVFGKEKYITPLGSMIPALFCKTAACIDPYIYAATHPRFRMEFRRFFGCGGHFRRRSTTRSSYLTRSSTRRLRVISDVDMINRAKENNKNINLQVVQELTEENDDSDFVVEELHEISNNIEQSRF